MTKCSFCNVEGHRITSCRDPRITQVMNAVEYARSREMLRDVLERFTCSELSIVMVQYDISGVSLCKSRKIELILNRCERAPRRTREPETREPAAREPAAREPVTRVPVTREPVTRVPVTREPAPVRRPREPTSQERRVQALKLAKSASESTFAQAKILYKRVRDGMATLEEVVVQYNDYRRMIITASLTEMNSGPDDYITMSDCSSALFGEMNRLVRDRSISIGRTMYEGLLSYAAIIRASSVVDIQARVALFRNKKYLLTRDALQENLLSPNEMDDATREMERLIHVQPIYIARASEAAQSNQSHLKPLCIEIKKSSVKIEEVIERDSVEECMICMTGFTSKNANEVPLVMGCEHVCCTGCFITMAKTRTKSFINCPFCRQEVAECLTPNKESMDLVLQTIKTV